MSKGKTPTSIDGGALRPPVEDEVRLLEERFPEVVAAIRGSDRLRALANGWERSADGVMERALYGDGCGMATASALRSCAASLRAVIEPVGTSVGTEWDPTVESIT